MIIRFKRTTPKDEITRYILGIYLEQWLGETYSEMRILMPSVYSELCEVEIITSQNRLWECFNVQTKKWVTLVEPANDFPKEVIELAEFKDAVYAVWDDGAAVHRADSHFLYEICRQYGSSELELFFDLIRQEKERYYALWRKRAIARGWDVSEDYRTYDNVDGL